MTEVKQEKADHDRNETKGLTELKLNSQNSDRIEMI